jgi:hypothetical protein
MERPDDGAWAASVERFAAWLAEVSPFYRELRSEVLVHADAPARLGEFWRIVGWAPEVGLSRSWDRPPQRPERHLGRALAEKAFSRWLRAECFAPTLKLSEPTVAALWDRLPPRPWVHRVLMDRPLQCHGGIVNFVDEDAGDDPPVMSWDTTEVKHAHPLAVEPHPLGPSGVDTLMSWTVAGLFHNRTCDVALPAPTEPGPFAPAYPHVWELGPGVWGAANHGPDGDPRVISEVLCQSPRAYLDHLLALPSGQAADYSADGYWVESAHMLMVEDAKALAPELLAEQGGIVLSGQRGFVVGKVDEIPVMVHRHFHNGRPAGDEIVVAPEDYAALRQIMKREKIRAYQNMRPRRQPSASEPTDAERALAARLAAEAADQPPPTLRPRRRSAVTVTVEPAVEAAVRELGGLMRQRILAALPGVELVPPTFAPDEPPLVRALWEELGYSDELTDLVGWPDRVSSDDALAAVLDDYRSWESPLTRRKLPRVCRLLAVDDQGCGLAVTDESVPSADPPVLGFSSDTAQSEQENPSYVAWVVEQLAEFAADNGEASCVVETHPPLWAPGADTGPRTRRLSSLVWADPDSGDGRWWRLGARRLADVIDWLATTDTIERFALREQPRPAAWMFLTSFTPTAELRICDAPSGPGRYHVGTIDGVTILVNTAGDQAILYAAPEDGKRAEALATARGWIAA